ncbi:MAG: hypothetical protein JRE43_06640 [Deltaproteobacteria bacterium]|nr:hypothetical protein [Deltaproteobacteria bacterium]
MVIGNIAAATSDRASRIGQMSPHPFVLRNPIETRMIPRKSPGLATILWSLARIDPVRGSAVPETKAPVVMPTTASNKSARPEARKRLWGEALLSAIASANQIAAKAKNAVAATKELAVSP